MNPENLIAAAHPTTQTSALPPATHVTIVELELLQQFTPHYDVTLRLCRPLTNYEARKWPPTNPSDLTSPPTTRRS